MFVSISRYRVKAGLERGLQEHNEAWKDTIRPRASGFISVHVYRNAKDPAEWTSVATFVDQYAENENANSPEHKQWYRQMLELLEAPPVYWQGDLVQEG